MVCSFILTHGTLGLITMWPFCTNHICPKLASIYVHRDNYFEYLLGDSIYMGEEMFVMRWLWRWKLVPWHDLKVMHAYNKMHVSYKVWVEWGIRGLKCKWTKLMKRFESTKLKYNHFSKLLLSSLISYTCIV